MTERKRLSKGEKNMGFSKAQMAVITKKRLATSAELLKKQQEERMAKAAESVRAVTFEAAPTPVEQKKPSNSWLFTDNKKRRYVPSGFEIKISGKLYRALQVFTNGEWGTIAAEDIHQATPLSRIHEIDIGLTRHKERWAISGYFGDASFRIATVPAPVTTKMY